MDFTQMPVSKGYKYLLVMTDTFTGWIEGFPTWTEKAAAAKLLQSCLTLCDPIKVVKEKLLHEIIPRFGLPRSLQSDNGTSFTSKVTQRVLKHWALLIISIVPGSSVFRKSRKSQPIR